jgi:hypothetical protein
MGAASGGVRLRQSARSARQVFGQRSHGKTGVEQATEAGVLPASFFGNPRGPTNPRIFPLARLSCVLRSDPR